MVLIITAQTGSNHTNVFSRQKSIVIAKYVKNIVRFQGSLLSDLVLGRPTIFSDQTTFNARQTMDWQASTNSKQDIQKVTSSRE